MGIQKKEKRLIVIQSGGVLPELNYITGPVLNPWKVDLDIVRKLVTNGRVVYEVNPENHDERVRLTQKNLATSNFGVQAVKEAPMGTQKPAPIDKQAAKKEEKQTVKPEVQQNQQAQKNEQKHTEQKKSDFTEQKNK